MYGFGSRCRRFVTRKIPSRSGTLGCSALTSSKKKKKKSGLRNVTVGSPVALQDQWPGSNHPGLNFGFELDLEGIVRLTYLASTCFCLLWRPWYPLESCRGACEKQHTHTHTQPYSLRKPFLDGSKKMASSLAGSSRLNQGYNPDGSKTDMFTPWDHSSLLPLFTYRSRSCNR